MKKFILACFLFLGIVVQAQQIKLGDSFTNESFKDQFDKEYTITNKTKKLLFAFSKDNGHIIKDFMEDKPNNYLLDKNILFIADISAMPSIIASWFAIPDMKKSGYPILLIKDEELALRYKKEQMKDSFMILHLENKKITTLEYLKGKENIINWIQEN